MPKYIDPQTVPLPRGAVARIAKILEEEWDHSPAAVSAARLHAAGFTSLDLWKFGKTRKARLQPDQWRNNTYSYLRDAECGRGDGT